MRLFSMEDKRARFDVVEGPADRSTVTVDAGKHDALTLQSTLHGDEIIELRTHKDHTPSLQGAVEEPHRCSELPLFLTLGRISDPDVLQRVAIQHPAKQQFTLLVDNPAVVPVEGVV